MAVCRSEVVTGRGVHERLVGSESGLCVGLRLGHVDGSQSMVDARLSHVLGSGS